MTGIFYKHTGTVCLLNQMFHHIFIYLFCQAKNIQISVGGSFHIVIEIWHVQQLFYILLAYAPEPINHSDNVWHFPGRLDHSRYKLIADLIFQFFISISEMSRGRSTLAISKLSFQVGRLIAHPYIYIASPPQSALHMFGH